MKRSILFPARFMTIPQILTQQADIPNGLQNQPYSFQFTESGGIYPFTWSATITPNTGSQFSLDPITGILSSANPTTAETETVVVQVSDAMAPHNVAQATFTFAVNTTVVITTASLPTATATVPYSFTMGATGGTPPYTWAMSPTSVDGLTLNSVSGVLSGTPASATTATVTFTATDSANLPSAPVSLTLTVQASGTQPNAPSQMFAGPVLSDRIRIDWWPDTSLVNTAHSATVNPPAGPNTPVDTNKYNVYRATGTNQPFSAAAKIAAASDANAIVPRAGPGGSTILYYYFNDGPGANPTNPPASGTTYTYYVTAVSATGVESAPGPSLNMTTLAGSATPPTIPATVTDPATWIVPFQLPVGGTTYTPANAAALTTALAAAIPGDVIILTAGVTYSLSNGFTTPAYAGPGWVYIISSEDPVLKSGGKLPAYVDYTGPTYPVAYGLTAAPGIGATSATLTTVWTQKTGIYPVQFFNATTGSNSHEQRYVLFTKNSSAISWSVASTGTRNPCGITSSIGPGLSHAATNTISVVYLPGVTLYDFDNGAFPIIQGGGTASNGNTFVIATNATNIRMVGIKVQPIPTNPTDNGQFHNFYCVELGNVNNNIYFDRCIIGGDSSTFTTSGGPNWTVTSTSYGFVAHGIGNSHCNNLLIHQCYFQGIVQAPSNPGTDANGINILGNGPIAIQYNHIEAESEGVLFGGSFTVKNDNPHDITYRGNYNTKLQWWLANTQNLFPPFPLQTFTFTGDGATKTFSGLTNATFGRSERWYVTIAGVVQAPSTYTINPTANTITFAVAPASGAAISVRGQAEFYFADNVKNLCEWKTGIRANCYGNTHWNCWYSNQSGYRGSSWSPDCRDQQAAASVNNSTIFNTCPWAELSDIYIHDNVSWGVGQAVNIFGGVDHGPTSETTRIRLHNEQFWLHNPVQAAVDPIYGGNLWFTLPQGLLGDIIWDNITVVMDPTSGAVPNATTSFYFNAGTVGDRWQITDSIFPGITAVSGDNVFRLSNTNPGNPGFAGWTNNLTITDSTGPFGTGITYKAVPYASIGFKNYVSNLQPPTQPSDWNVLSSTFIGTDGNPVGATFPTLQFPLLGAYLIGAPVQTSFGTTAFQQKVATRNAVIIGTYPNWSGGGFTNATAAGAVKAINPNIKLTQYTKIMEADQAWASQGTLAFGPMWTHLSANNEWLRATYPGGAIELTGAGANCVNIFDTEWQSFVSTWSAGNVWAPNFDGVYTDNVFFQPNSAGDYLKNGTTQTAAASAQGWRNAYAAYIPQLRTALPANSKQCWGNVADWAVDHTITGYNQMLSGGVMESAIGQSFSWEHTSWLYLMNSYANVMNALIPPGYMVFEQDNASATAYAAMRYGLCSCLLDNGYFYYNISGVGGGNVITPFDEESFNLGAAIAGPNNPNNGTYSSGGLTVWQNGVWRRDFQNGIVLVNPRGNHPNGVGVGATVTLETTYYHLRGTQDPTTNNAAAVTSVTLPDPNVAGTGGSGLFLSRTPT